MCSATSEDADEAIQAAALPGEAWCKALSYVLRSSRCLGPVSAASPWLRELAGDPLSWEGAAACVLPADLDEQGGRPLFEALVPKWTYCRRVSVNFKECHMTKDRVKAERCFQMLAQQCREAACVCVRNWLMFERSGLSVAACGFPRLRHLELSSCDHISHYEAMIPVFKAHPGLLSLRASFRPKAAAGLDFAEAAPATLVSLGFVSFESPEALARLLDRCHLQHLWFDANCAYLKPSMVEALKAGASRLRTLALPSSLGEECCRSISEECPSLELLCRMRIGTPAFGSDALQQGFELLPGGGGVVVRRRGSSADLAANGSLWAPYLQGDHDLEGHKPASASGRPSWGEAGPRRCARSEMAINASKITSCEKTRVAFEVAAAVAARRRRAAGGAGG